MSKTGKLVVISGPSGVGKGTIARRVMAQTGAAFSVSATTRAPRPGEIDGRDYRFVDRGTFEKLVADGQMLEWAEVFGQLYGTPREPVRQTVQAGGTILLDIDVQGGLQVHDAMPDATFVLIVPPSDEELARRLHGRGSEDAAAAGRRLEKAKQEIAAAAQSGVYNHIVINDDLETAVGEVIRIVQQEPDKG